MMKLLSLQKGIIFKLSKISQKTPIIKPYPNGQIYSAAFPVNLKTPYHLKEHKFLLVKVMLAKNEEIFQLDIKKGRLRIYHIAENHCTSPIINE